MRNGRTMVDTPRWWRALAGDDETQARLLCIPHAGAPATVYARWPSLFGVPGIGLYAAQLPGRGPRLREAPKRDVQSLAEALAIHLAPLLDRPYFLFGHSFGALLAFELARCLRRVGLPLPLRLLVSGRAAPDVLSPTPHLHELPQDAFLAELAARYGRPDATLADPEMADLLCPTLRADITAIEHYELRDEPPLACAIEAFVGQDDRAVSPDALNGWRQHGSSVFRRHVLLGGHFYLQEQPAALLALIRRSVMADLASGTP